MTLFATTTGKLSAQTESALNAESQPSTPIAMEKVAEKHSEPPGVNYDDNPSVFGEILRGEAPAKTFAESEDLLAFEDRSPRAPLHALVIPKRFIPTVFDLEQTDLKLLEDMRAMGLQLVRQRHPEAFDKQDYILCFHVPPFNSVNHLHLHVLAPASKMTFVYRYLKYQVGTRWCISDEAMQRRLDTVPLY